MTSVIHDEKIKEKCQIFTPKEISKRMLDLAGYTTDILDKAVLENSCGDGEILSVIVERYISECLAKELNVKQIKKLLQKNIVAYEIDCNLADKCKNRLDKICELNGISNIKWNIQCADFLTANIKKKFDYIIGNPPYIAYPDLPKDTQKFLKESFQTCKKGKFDYSYAFIEKSYRLLKRKGKLVYIIPSNIFKNVFAKTLRELLKNDLEAIVDFPKDRIFKKALVSPAIIKVVKDSKKVEFSYTQSIENEEQQESIKKETLEEKWCFGGIFELNGTRLGDHFKVSSAIATLCNDAFVLKKGKLDSDFYYIDNYKIENTLIRKAASPKGKKYCKYEEYMIFPYYFDKYGMLQHYSEEEMYSKFPNAMNYLNKHKEALLKRDADMSAKWFEYGRSQAIQNMNQKKILISSVISECTNAYLLERNEIPYSGLYIIPTGEYSLEDLLIKINSDKFKAHIANVGVCVSGTSKRVTPSDIENFCY